jgi:hypothetical protein
MMNGENGPVTASSSPLIPSLSFFRTLIRLPAPLAPTAGALWRHPRGRGEPHARPQTAGAAGASRAALPALCATAAALAGPRRGLLSLPTGGALSSGPEYGALAFATGVSDGAGGDQRTVAGVKETEGSGARGQAVLGGWLSGVGMY